MQTVWLLKTQTNNDPYLKILTDAGFSVIFVPLLEFQWTNQLRLQNILLNGSSRYSGIIATSPRTMDALATAIESLRTESKMTLWTTNETIDTVLAKWASLPLFAVGEKTAEKSPISFQSKFVGSGGAAQLAQQIVAWFQSSLNKSKIPLNAENGNIQEYGVGQLKPLLFLCGNLRRDDLPAILHSHGVPMEEITVYETKFTTDGKQQQQQQPDWIVFFSPSGVNSMLTKFEPSHDIWKRARKAAIGQTTKAAIEMIPELGKVDAVAPKPSPQDLLQAILSSSHK
jgi:uroporphyrinogen-III synthase